MGRPAFFIRLFGCPVHCPWCDSAGTWHPEHIPKDIARLDAFEVLNQVNPNCEFVVITGGEPCIHDLGELTEKLQGYGYRTHLETSGAFPIRGAFDWITVSPKKWKLPIPEALQKANEFKFIIEAPEDIEFYWDLVKNGAMPVPDIWLHPEWSHREDPKVLTAIVDAVKRERGQFRAGWQLHKLFRADLLDDRSRPPVPLGGVPAKGF